MKKILLVLLGLGVTAGCFYWSMRGTTLDGLAESFRTANYWTLPLLLLFLFSFYWLKSQRWTWLLLPVQSLTTQQLFPPVMIGFAANNLLPAHLGEFVRVFVVRKNHNVSAATVLSTVVLERFFDVMAILGLFAFSLQFATELPPEYSRSAFILAVLATMFVVCATVFLIWTDVCISLYRVCLGKILRVPEHLVARLIDLLTSAGDGLHALRSTRAVALIVINSLLQWILNGLIAWIALWAFGVPVIPTDGLIVTTVVAIAVMVPSTPGYFGVMQLAFRVSLMAMAIDVDQSQVLAASLYYHVSVYIPVTALGLFYLYRQGLSLRDLSRVAVASTDQDGP